MFFNNIFLDERCLMADYNRIIMVGNLTRDPDHRLLPSGQSVCRLGLASNRQFKNRQTGTMVQEVCYVDIDVWGPQADSCKQYLQKGRAILVEGRLKFDTWEDQNGQTRSKHIIVADRVVFLSQGLSTQDSSVQTMGEAKSDTDTQLEKELLDQIDQIKERAAKKDEPVIAEEKIEAAKPEKPVAKKTKKADASDSSGNSEENPAGVQFKDEPPFQDDLPF